MSIDAFLRQGFIPFAQAMGEQTGILAEVIPKLRESAVGAAQIGRPDRLVFIGIGASLAALAAPASYLSAHGTPSLRLNAADAEPLITGDETLVALSQSGRSRETVSAMRAARGRKLAVVNVSGSPMALESEAVLALGDLHDSLASTIGFTASVIAVSMLCEVWVEGRPSDSWLTLCERVERFLSTHKVQIELLAGMVGGASMIDIVAPAEQLGVAESSALLLREVARIPTAPFETRQYLHGLMESTSPSTLHLIVDGPDDGQIARALRSLDRDVVEFRTGSAAAVDPRVVVINAASPLEVPVFAAALFQQVALRTALARGIDPDQFLFLDTGTKLEDDE